MHLPEEFWNAYRGLILIESNGDLRFTAAGRAQLAPELAKYNLSISTIRTLPQLMEAMDYVVQRELDENDRKLRELLKDPELTAEEREILEEALSFSDDPDAKTPQLKLV
jgi:uncharacterized membrane protein YukC